MAKQLDSLTVGEILPLSNEYGERVPGSVFISINQGKKTVYLELTEEQVREIARASLAETMLSKEQQDLVIKVLAEDIQLKAAKIERLNELLGRYEGVIDELREQRDTAREVVE